jgi:hypothetical protein
VRHVCERTWCPLRQPLLGRLERERERVKQDTNIPCTSTRHIFVPQMFLTVMPVSPSSPLPASPPVPVAVRLSVPSRGLCYSSAPRAASVVGSGNGKLDLGLGWFVK